MRSSPVSPSSMAATMWSANHLRYHAKLYPKCALSQTTTSHTKHVPAQQKTQQTSKLHMPRSGTYGHCCPRHWRDTHVGESLLTCHHLWVWALSIQARRKQPHTRAWSITARPQRVFYAPTGGRERYPSHGSHLLFFTFVLFVVCSFAPLFFVLVTRSPMIDEKARHERMLAKDGQSLPPNSPSQAARNRSATAASHPPERWL